MTVTPIVRRPDGVTLLAILHFFSGGVGIISSLILLLIGLMPLMVMRAVPALAMLILFFIGAVVVGAVSILVIFTGVGLLRIRNWARWVTIVLAILSLPAFPFGTVVGGLIIWYLLQDSIAVLFENRLQTPITA
ncbi:MAG: hypothetical protein ACYCZF_06455 [Anaerolineae bacterium]